MLIEDSSENGLLVRSV